MTSVKGETEMVKAYKQVLLVAMCSVVVFQSQSSARAAGSAPDSVGKAWSDRAAAATKKLAAPGLDKCDKGVEEAFQYPEETTSGNLRSFNLMIDIDGQEMVVSYSYVGQLLKAFILDELPPGWLAEQKTDSKTLKIIVESSKCTFELCTNDPFVSGQCAR
jgi:hypothetical protein